MKKYQALSCLALLGLNFDTTASASETVRVQFYESGVAEIRQHNFRIRLNSAFDISWFSSLRNNGLKVNLYDSVDTGEWSDYIEISDADGEKLLTVWRSQMDYSRIGAIVSTSTGAADPSGVRTGSKMTEALGQRFFCITGESYICSKDEASRFRYGYKFTCDPSEERDGLIDKTSPCYEIESIGSFADFR